MFVNSWIVISYGSIVVSFGHFLDQNLTITEKQKNYNQVTTKL